MLRFWLHRRLAWLRRVVRIPRRKVTVTDQDILDEINRGLDIGDFERFRLDGGGTGYRLTKQGESNFVEASRLQGGEFLLGTLLSILLPADFGEVHGGHVFQATTHGGAKATLKVLGVADETIGIIFDHHSRSGRTTRLLVKARSGNAVVAGICIDASATVPLDRVHMTPIPRRRMDAEALAAALDLEPFYQQQARFDRTRN